MRRIAAALAVCLAIGLAAPARADDAKALFARKCAACHGPDGKGKTPMGQKLGATDLTTYKDTVDDISRDIEKGKGKMPPVKGLSKEEVSSLAKYVKGGLK